MDSSSKKLRVAHLGKDVARVKIKTKDVVSDIINSMDSNVMSKTGKVVSYKELEEYRNREQNNKTTTSNFCNMKRFLPEKKHPLMTKCQKNLKILKHNRSVPKPRAHLSGTMDIPVKNKFVEKSIEKIAPKKNFLEDNKLDTIEKTLNNSSKKKLTCKVLQSDDDLSSDGVVSNKSKKNSKTLKAADFDGNASDGNLSSKSQRLMHKEHQNSSSESDFEKFILLQKNKMSYSSDCSSETPEYNRIKLKKRKKKQKSRKNNEKKEKNNPTTSHKENISDNEVKSTFVNESDKEEMEVQHSCHSDIDDDLWPVYFSDNQYSNVSSSNEINEEESSKTVLDHNFTLNLNDSSSKEYIDKLFPPCIVRIIRNPVLDKEVLSDMLLLNSESERLTESLTDVVIVDSDDDDCTILCEVPKNSLIDKMDTIADKSHTPCITSDTSLPSYRNTTQCLPEQNLVFFNPTTIDVTKPSVKFNVSLQQQKKSPDNSDLNIQILSVESLTHNIDLGNSNTVSDPNNAIVENSEIHLVPDNVKIKSLNAFNLQNVVGTSLKTDPFTFAKKYCKIPNLETNFSENVNPEFKAINCNVASLPSKDKLLNNLLDKIDVSLINEVSKIKSDSLFSNNNLPFCFSEIDTNKDIPEVNSSKQPNIVSLNVNNQNNGSSINSILETVSKTDLKHILSMTSVENPVHNEKQCIGLDVNMKSKVFNSDISSPNFQGNESLMHCSKKAVFEKVPNKANFHNLLDFESLPVVNRLSPEETVKLPTDKIYSHDWEHVKIALKSVSNSEAMFSNNSSSSKSSMSHFTNLVKSELNNKNFFVNTQSTELKGNKNLSEIDANLVKKEVLETPADNLDMFAFESIQKLNMSSKESIVPLFHLYKKEWQQYKKIISAEKNVSTGLRMLEENQVKKLKSLTAAINNIMEQNPCFYKVAKDETDEKVQNVQTIQPSSIMGASTSSRNDAINNKWVKCNNCSNWARLKCEGCQNAFYCSNECGVNYWKREHHSKCC